MSLFVSQDVSSYLKTIGAKISTEIEAFSNEKISTADFSEWGEYYYQKYSVDPIVLYESQKVFEAVECTEKAFNPLYSGRSYGSSTIDVPAYKVTVSIPFSGNRDLLNLKPSTSYVRSFPAEIKRGAGDDLDQIKVDATFQKNEVKDKEDLMSYVQRHFENEIKYYREMVKNINYEVNNFNQNLRKHIHLCLEKRKAKASDFLDFCGKLNIPIKRNEDAPNIVPIPLKRVIKQIPAAPQSKTLVPEYGISDEDYQNIAKIIDMFCISNEKAASTFIKFEEEEIRNALISMLNTHYTIVSGEAFRKKGKTDILVEFDGKAGYIAECKVWHGIKAFEEALVQLNSYMTWRDYKVALILFNKTNSNFSQVLANINTWVNKNSSDIKHKAANIWDCIVKRSDRDETYELTIHVYDFYISESI